MVVFAIGIELPDFMGDAALAWRQSAEASRSGWIKDHS
jgi:hypothetical protein